MEGIRCLHQCCGSKTFVMDLNPDLTFLRFRIRNRIRLVNITKLILFHVFDKCCVPGSGFKTWSCASGFGKKFWILTNPDSQHCSVLILFFLNWLKNGPHSDQFRSDIIRIRTYFAFGERDIRTIIVRTKVSFGHVLFGERSFGDRSFGETAFGDLTVYQKIIQLGQQNRSTYVKSKVEIYRTS
jgi:hypothetical protein